ncbi:MAG: hypothetical protein IJ443_02655, partial [Firmicutes bacterium]|nr:hypothetical protein [Bacillota bacterium]
MAIRITTKGIRETLGNGNRFQTLPREVKKYKIAALRKLPELIEIGDVTLDDVENIHCESGFHFAYIESEMIIDEIRVDVRISIKKRLNSNHFWIHKVDRKEKLRITHSIL